MSKQVTVEELEEHLHERLEDVQRGESISITQDGREIAVLQPHQRLRVHRADPRRFQDVPISPKPKGLDIDPAEIIIQERERERSNKKWQS